MRRIKGRVSSDSLTDLRPLFVVAVMISETITTLGHGILAMDESNVACGLRLTFIGLQNTKVNH